MKNSARPDGIDVFESACREMGVSVMDLIARTARWADPVLVTVLPVWYPAFYRERPLFRADWKTPLLHKGQRQKLETNQQALATLEAALGGKGDSWTCCHIWGYSDGRFREKEKITRDPRYYTCLPNMVLLPTPLKAMTDCMEPVRQALRVCSWNLYGWTPDLKDAPEAEAVRSGAIPDCYPSSWPRNGDKSVPGLVNATPAIFAKALARKAAIADELRRADGDSLSQYPAGKVREILAEWQARTGSAVIGRER